MIICFYFYVNTGCVIVLLRFALKISGLRAVGLDAPDLCGGDENHIRFFTLQKSIRRRGLAQIQLSAGAPDDLGKARGLQRKPKRSAHHALVTGDVDFEIPRQAHE